jgi:hypothetical protein
MQGLGMSRIGYESRQIVSCSISHLSALLEREHKIAGDGKFEVSLREPHSTVMMLSTWHVQ